MSKTLTLLIVTVFAAFLVGCDVLPRVRVLHDPLTAREHVTLGMIYEMEGRAELALREYSNAIRQQPAHVPALTGLGNLAFKRDALAEAEAYFLQALAVASNNAAANNNLAMVYLLRREHLEEAEMLAVHALMQGGPLRPYVLDTLAHIYFQQGRYREALTILETAEAVAPADDRVLQERLAQLRKDLGASTRRSEQNEKVLL